MQSEHIVCYAYAKFDSKLYAMRMQNDQDDQDDQNDQDDQDDQIDQNRMPNTSDDLN
jgi:hypothetical protein